MKNKIKLLPIILLLTVSILSCNFLTKNLGTKNINTLPMETIQPIPTVEPSQNLAPLPSSTEDMTVTVTDAEVNQWLQESMQGNTDFILQNPTISFKSGYILVGGKLNNGLLSGDAQLTLSTQVQSDGTVNILVEKMQLGGIQAPSAIKSMAESTLNSYFMSYFQSMVNGYLVKSVVIQDGEMIITASPK